MGSFELSDPVALILREIADRRMHRKDIALTYALVMQAVDRHRAGPGLHDATCDPFERINRAILGRWKFSGLEWIKERAWKIAEGKV